MSCHHINKIVDEAARWGVPTFFIRDLPDDFLSPADSDVGCDWRRKRIYIDVSARTAACAVSLLHELSHVIFDKNPNRVDEVTSGMLAFEHDTARRLGMLRAWNLWMRSYVLSHGGDWEHSSNYRRKTDLKVSRAAANKLGVLCRRTPTYKSPRA